MAFVRRPRRWWSICNRYFRTYWASSRTIRDLSELHGKQILWRQRQLLQGRAAARHWNFQDCEGDYYNVTIALSESSDDLPQKCQEQVCAIRFSDVLLFFFFLTAWSHAGAVTQPEIIVRLWNECLFLLVTPTLPHFFKELKLKVSECVFLSLKINDSHVAAGSRNRNRNLFRQHLQNSRTSWEFLLVLGH